VERTEGDILEVGLDLGEGDSEAVTGFVGRTASGGESKVVVDVDFDDVGQELRQRSSVSIPRPER
jgi:hypothetical protein